MTVIQVADVAFGYGAEKLFSGVTFSLALGERASLVAPNGAGKTTLLRILVGELQADQGSIVLRRDSRVAYYRQSHELALEGTIFDALMSGFKEVIALRTELASAQKRAGSGKKSELDELARAAERYHIAQGDELERRVQVIAQSLGFAPNMMDRPVASLSGGERGRLHLGVVLAQQPDLLLLDEPTNHLDLGTIDWLEAFLKAYTGAVLIVSHDRAFLDNVCPRTFELGHKLFRVYPLRYSDYVEAREADLERERALAERQQSMISKTEDFIRRNIAGQKTKQAQSRRKMLEKLERPEDTWQVAQKVSFRFAPAPRTGDIVLDAKGLGAERGGRSLFSGVHLLVRRGERIAIVGPNGAGKTTLLKILAGVAAPDDQGNVRRGANLCEGYFDQELGLLNLEHTAVEEIRSVRGDLNEDGARTYLARFRFWGDQPFQTVASFSGGERSRLALAKLLLEPRNVLYLDEPTNHLDIPSAEILEEALVNFDGTTIFISHDRRFLENVSTRVVMFRDEHVDIVPGSYGELSTPSFALDDDDQEPERTELEESRDERSARRAQFEATKAVARAAERKQRRFQELEELIAKSEVELGSLRDKLNGASTDEWEKLSKMAQEQQALELKIEAMMNEWSSLGEELSSEQAVAEGES